MLEVAMQVVAQALPCPSSQQRLSKLAITTCGHSEHTRTHARTEECPDAVLSVLYLEVVRQLSATSIARVHGDKGIGVVVDLHEGAFKVELVKPSLLGLVDGQDLLRYD